MWLEAELEIQISGDMLHDLYFQYRLEEVRDCTLGKLQQYIQDWSGQQGKVNQEYYQMAVESIHPLKERLNQLDQENKGINLKLKKLEAALPLPVAAKVPSNAPPVAAPPSPAGVAILQTPTPEELLKLLNTHTDWHATPDKPLPEEEAKK